MEGKLTVAKVKQVIFSAAANHGIRDVGPFLQSAAKHVPGSRAFLLLYPKDLGRSEALEIRKSGTGVDFLLAPRWGRRIRPFGFIARPMEPRESPEDSMHLYAIMGALGYCWPTMASAVRLL